VSDSRPPSLLALTRMRQVCGHPGLVPAADRQAAGLPTKGATPGKAGASSLASISPRETTDDAAMDGAIRRKRRRGQAAVLTSGSWDATDSMAFSSSGKLLALVELLA